MRNEPERNRYFHPGMSLKGKVSMSINVFYQTLQALQAQSMRQTDFDAADEMQDPFAAPYTLAFNLINLDMRTSALRLLQAHY